MVRLKRPFNEGDTVVVTPDELGARGAALALHEGWSVRVVGGLPGETARVRIVHVSKGGPVAEAKFLEVVGKSHPGRCPVRCPIHSRCGGCGLQHATAASMLVEKIDQARKALPADVTWEEPVASQQAFGYRTKTFFLAEKGRFAVRSAGGRSLVDTRDCGVVTPALREASNDILDSLLPRVPLRTVMLRANRLGDVQATLVQAGAPTPELLEAASDLPLDRVFVQQHDAPGNRIHSDEPEILVKGPGPVVESFAHGIESFVPPTAFCQGNPFVADAMYQHAASALTGDRIAEIYCGAGVAGLMALKLLPDATLYAIDKSPRAIATALANAQRNQMVDRCVFEAKAAEDLPDTKWDSVLLNPPRAGCHASVLERVRASGARRVVYMSCNPQTLARDVERLGWRVMSVRAGDMFPQTPHLELLVVLEP